MNLFRLRSAIFLFHVKEGIWVRIPAATPFYTWLRREVIRLLYTESDVGSSPTPGTSFVKSVDVEKSEVGIPRESVSRFDSRWVVPTQVSTTTTYRILKRI